MQQLASHLRGQVFDAVVDASCYGPEDCRALLAALPAMPTTYVLLSSAAVYQRSTAPLPFAEASPAHGDEIWGPYGRDKAEAEAVLLCASAIPRPFVLRPPYIYGPGNNLDRERFVWARQLANEPIFVPGDGETLIQFVSIDDVARAIVGFLDSQCAVAPGIYNLAFETYVPSTSTSPCWARSPAARATSSMSRTRPSPHAIISPSARPTWSCRR